MKKKYDLEIAGEEVEIHEQQKFMLAALTNFLKEVLHTILSLVKELKIFT